MKKHDGDCAVKAELQSLTHKDFNSVDAAQLFDILEGNGACFAVNLYPGNHRVAYNEKTDKVFDYTAYPQIMSSRTWVKFIREKFRKVK